MSTGPSGKEQRPGRGDYGHQPRRLLQQHRVGPARGAGQEVREVLPVLHRAVSGHQVQHHDPPKDALLHGQPNPAVRRYLFRDVARLLHPGQLGREDHDGHHHPKLPQHLPVASRRDQPADVPRDAAHRQIPALHDGARHVLDHRHGVRAEHPLPVAVDPHHVAVDTRAVPERAAAAPADAATTGARRPLSFAGDAAHVRRRST